MSIRADLHTLLDRVPDERLEEAKEALEALVAPELSDEDYRELMERNAEMDREGGIDARELLAQWRSEPR